MPNRNIYFRQETYDAIELIANMKQISFNEAVREALEAYVTERSQQAD